MESTDKYWIPIFNVLEPSYHILLSDHKYIKAIPAKKLTKKILYGLQTFINTGLFVAAEFIQGLFEILKILYVIDTHWLVCISEENRVQNSLTISNIMISSPDDTNFYYESLLHKSLRHWLFPGSPYKASKTSVNFKYFDYINECIYLMGATIVPEIGVDMSKFNSSKHLYDLGQGLRLK